MRLSLLGLLSAVMALQGCSYAYRATVTPVKLGPIPSHPLRASLLREGDDRKHFGLVLRTLEASRYFSEIKNKTDASTDVEITVRDVKCGENFGLDDNALMFFLVDFPQSLVMLATAGLVPAYNHYSHCWVNFSYRFPNQAGKRTHEVSSAYKNTVYSAFLSYPLLSSEKREEYQKERVVDDGVAALLNEISQKVAGMGEAP